jgi:ubiquinone/menaquinone biosynthesis C-methylase UbiE
LAVAALDLRDHHRVLDIGCGGGVGLRLLLNQIDSNEIVGVDRSSDIVASTSRRMAEEIAKGRLSLQIGRVEELPLAEGRFDRVVTVNTFMYWDDADRGLQEMLRVLRSGGRAVLVVPPPEILRLAGLDPRRHRLEHTEQIEARFRSAGFVAVQVRHCKDLKQSTIIAASKP